MKALQNVRWLPRSSKGNTVGIIRAEASIDVTPNLRRHYRRSRCRRSDDTGKHTLPQNLLPRTGLDGKDNPTVQRHKQQLGNHHADMPAMGFHLMEIDTAES